MDVWENWEFSSESEDRLNKICLNLNETCQISNDLLALLNYDSQNVDNCQMEVDDDDEDRKEEILKTVKKCLECESVLQETAFVGVSLNFLTRILQSVNASLDEFGFCSFCKFIVSWSNSTLVEHSLRSLVLERLKQTSEASGCVIFSVKELAISKPEELCQNVLVPLLTTEGFEFSDVELLSGVFTVLPPLQKDFIIRKFLKKTEFVEGDWKLLLPIVKDLSQTSLLSLLECIQKFAHRFTKSTVFGRFLVNFCKNFEFVGNKDALRVVVEKHETLLRNQAMKYLESGNWKDSITGRHKDRIVSGNEADRGWRWRLGRATDYEFPKNYTYEQYFNNKRNPISVNLVLKMRVNFYFLKQFKV